MYNHRAYNYSICGCIYAQNNSFAQCSPYGKGKLHQTTARTARRRHGQQSTPQRAGGSQGAVIQRQHTSQQHNYRAPIARHSAPEAVQSQPQHSTPEGNHSASHRARTAPEATTARRSHSTAGHSARATTAGHSTPEAGPEPSTAPQRQGRQGRGGGSNGQGGPCSHVGNKSKLDVLLIYSFILRWF